MRNNTAVEEAGRLGTGNGEEPRLTNRTSDAGGRNFSKQSGACKGGLSRRCSLVYVFKRNKRVNGAFLH